MGSAQDFAVVGTRRMFINACYWCVGLEEKIDAKSNVDMVGEFNGTPQNKSGPKGVKPADHALPI
jgi:hypothetical protein